MSFNQSYESARRAAASFMLGGAFAAMLVMAFAGASLVLSRASVIDARSPALDEFRLYRLPRPALSLTDLA